MISNFLHYFSAILAIMLGTVGGGIGLGMAGLGVIKAMNRQPTGSESNFKAMIIGLALIESGIVVSLVVALVILFGSNNPSLGVALMELGICVSTGIAALSSGIASSMVVKTSAESISRQPYFASKIITLMILAQSIIEAPVIFVFVISFIIKSNMSDMITTFDGIKYMSSSIAVSLGSIGTAIGQSIFAYTSCQSVGMNKNAYNKIFPFSLISQALIETPMILCLLISFLIIYTQVSINILTLQSIIFIVAAITIGFGSIGPAIGIGYATSKSCHKIASNPDSYLVLSKITLLVVAFVESAIVYAMIVSLILLAKVS
jgi:F-type H+-transporting ATPase subunit c